MLYLPLDSHLKLYTSYKLATVLQAIATYTPVYIYTHIIHTHYDVPFPAASVASTLEVAEVVLFDIPLSPAEVFLHKFTLHGVTFTHTHTYRHTHTHTHTDTLYKTH